MTALFLKTVFAFAATEIDDFLLYMLFFVQQKSSKSKALVFGGRLAATFVVCIFCAFVAQILSGFSFSYVRFLGAIPFALGIIRIFKKDEEEESVPEKASLFLSSFFLTCAASGDNAGVYIPFFVAMTLFQKIFCVVVFVLLQVLWSWLQIKASDLPPVQKVIAKAGRFLVPAVLILLGISIFLEI